MTSPTERALARLYRCGPGTRNVVRGWYALCLDEGEVPTVSHLAAHLGRSPGGHIRTTLRYLAESGILVRGQRANWSDARSGPGIDRADLLAELGRDLEPVGPGGRGEVDDCPDCGALRQDVAGCPLCRILAERPWLLPRLDYLAERAAAGLNLFDPAPPWACEEDRPAPVMALEEDGDDL